MEKKQIRIGSNVKFEGQKGYFFFGKIVGMDANEVEIEFEGKWDPMGPLEILTDRRDISEVEVLEF
jgi:hypothetical protein